MQKKYSFAMANYIFFFLFVCIICMAAIKYSNPDNDFYFLATTGRYIVENGEVPTVNPFVVHEDFGIIVQQWLADVVNYELYDCFGVKGLMGYCLLLFILINLAAYRYSGYFTSVRRLRLLVLCMTDFIVLRFLNSRPSIFSMGIFMAQLCLLERYRSEKKVRYLWVLPLLSLIEINYHASLWPLLFVLMLPYAVPDVRCLGKKGGLREQLWEVKAVWGIMIPMFLAGFLNPNGTKSMSYLFLSYQSANIDNYVAELEKPAVLSYSGFFVVLSVVCATVYVYRKRAAADSKTVYMYLGTLFLTCMHERNAWFLMYGFIPVLCIVAEDFFRKDLKKTLSGSRLACVLLLHAAGLAAAGAILFSVEIDRRMDADSYKTPYLAAQYLNGLDKEQVRLYTEFNNGAYMEWHGCRVYIDARPELYQKKINGKKNVYSEFICVREGDIDLGKFLTDYGFTHLITHSYTKLALYLEQCGDYEAVLKTKEYVMYQKKK